MFDLLIARYRPKWFEQWCDIRTINGQWHFLNRRFPELKMTPKDNLFDTFQKLRELLEEETKEKEYGI